MSNIVTIQSVYLVYGPWLANKEGHAENTFLKPSLQETRFAYRNKIVSRSKLTNGLKQIFSERKDFKN